MSWRFLHATARTGTSLSLTARANPTVQPHHEFCPSVYRSKGAAVVSASGDKFVWGRCFPLSGAHPRGVEWPDPTVSQPDSFPNRLHRLPSHPQLICQRERARSRPPSSEFPASQAGSSPSCPHTRPPSAFTGRRRFKPVIVGAFHPPSPPHTPQVQGSLESYRFHRQLPPGAPLLPELCKSSFSLIIDHIPQASTPV